MIGALHLKVKDACKALKVSGSRSVEQEIIVPDLFLFSFFYTVLLWIEDVTHRFPRIHLHSLQPSNKQTWKVDNRIVLFFILMTGDTKIFPMIDKLRSVFIFSRSEFQDFEIAFSFRSPTNP